MEVVGLALIIDAMIGLCLSRRLLRAASSRRCGLPMRAMRRRATSFAIELPLSRRCGLPTADKCLYAQAWWYLFTQESLNDAVPLWAAGPTVPSPGASNSLLENGRGGCVCSRCATCSFETRTSVFDWNPVRIISESAAAHFLNPQRQGRKPHRIYA